MTCCLSPPALRWLLHQGDFFAHLGGSSHRSPTTSHQNAQRDTHPSYKTWGIRPRALLSSLFLGRWRVCRERPPHHTGQSCRPVVSTAQAVGKVRTPLIEVLGCVVSSTTCSSRHAMHDSAVVSRAVLAVQCASASLGQLASSLLGHLSTKLLLDLCHASIHIMVVQDLRVPAHILLAFAYFNHPSGRCQLTS
jgi:hypothetical protein